MNPSPPERIAPHRAAALYAALLILAGFASFLLWGFVSFAGKYFIHEQAGRPLPNLTQILFDQRALLLFSPGPWALFAIYSVIRGSRSTYQLIFFSSTLILALILLILIAALAFTMPLVPLIHLHD